MAGNKGTLDGVKSQISGMRGVYLAAAELAQRGFIVSPTSRSARGIDLLATNADGTRTFAVEVKSVSKDSFWLIKKEATARASRNNIFVFVKLSKGESRSQFYVIPSKSLSKYIGGGPRFQNVKRARIKKYQDRWQAFGPTVTGD